MKLKYLLSRFGGIGDAVILTPVAKQLTLRGHEVHFTVPEHQVPLFDNLPECFERVHPTQRFHQVIDCVPWRWGWTSLEAIKDEFNVYMGEKDRQFSPIDYKYSVEFNAHQSYLGRVDYMGYWLRSQNSNFQNWVDLSLGWAGIDPTTVSPEDKIPVYKFNSFEKNWADRELRRTGRPVIGVHMVASSLSRTYYRHNDIVNSLLSEYPECTVLHWTGDRWMKVTRGGAEPMELPEHRMRHSVALIRQMDLLICADSAVSHYAAAIGKKSLTVYTTVPSWTRSLYYPLNTCLEAEVPCRPCFNLDRYCPLNQLRAQETLSDREQEIFDLEKRGIPPEQAAVKLNTQVESLNHEYNAARQRMEGIAGMVPDCVKAVEVDAIVGKAKEILNGK